MIIEWVGGNALVKKLDKDTYLLDYSVMNKDYTEGFGDGVKIRKCEEACLKGKWVAVPQDPFSSWYKSAVVYGGSPSVVARKVLKQVAKWREEVAKSGKEQGKHPVQERSAGEADSLPF